MRTTEQFRMARCMPAAACFFAKLPRLVGCAGQKRVCNASLSHSALPRQANDLLRKCLCQHFHSLSGMGGNQEWIISAIAFEKTLLLLLGSQVTFIENNAYWNVFPAAICQQLIQKQEIAGRFLHANHGPNLVHIGYSGPQHLILSWQNLFKEAFRARRWYIKTHTIAW